MSIIKFKKIQLSKLLLFFKVNTTEPQKTAAISMTNNMLQFRVFDSKNGIFCNTGFFAPG